jgi:hypothetical protein
MWAAKAGDRVGLMSVAEASHAHVLRRPCAKCAGTDGRVVERGSQDCVWCACGEYQYNAPRLETGKPVRHVKTRETISPSQRARILMVRANGRCEVCGTTDRELHVAHLLSIDAGKEAGLTERELNDDENLCAMCDACNLGLGRNPVPLRLAIGIQMARIRFQNKGLPK